MAIALAAVAISARLGMRGPILELLAGIALVRIATNRPVQRRALIASAVLAGGLFLIISTARKNLAEGFAADEQEQEMDRTLFQTLDPHARSEFDNVFANHSEMVRLAGTAFAFREGQSYVDLPLQLVPRKLVPDKPPQLSAWWVHYINPVAANRGAGLAFGSFTEGYLTFGPIGRIVQLCFITAMLRASYALLRSRSPGMPSVAGVILAHAYHSHRSEMIHVAFTARNAPIAAAAVLGTYKLTHFWPGFRTGQWPSLMRRPLSPQWRRGQVAAG